jgi:methylmalonyl-CoA mutase, C-terminal domain
MLRVLIAKVGLDGHDRGPKVVARILRDAGIEVIYAGLRQTPDMIGSVAVQEDVDVVGLSMHNGAHLTLAPAVVAALRAHGSDAAVVVGGIVPERDREAMAEAGIAALIGPGSSAEQIVEAVRLAARDRDSRTGLASS